jgi:phospholipase/carboxylesterase
MPSSPASRRPETSFDALQLLPAAGAPSPLLILLHGVGGQAEDLLPLGHRLRERFAQCAVVIPQGPLPFDAGPSGRQWFSVSGITEANRPERVTGALAPLIAAIRATQARLGVEPAATALVGFSQGAILSLEAAQAVDGLVGRVLAFSGRYAQRPEHAPRDTTLHLFHGSADTVIPVAHAREAIGHLGALQGDITLDIADGVGHVLHPALIDCALHRLSSHIPQRTWRAALGAAREG